MQKRLLFVDDEPAIRNTLPAILRQNGFEVSAAATVAEALFLITSEKFDVLLSDLNIGNPGDGLTVVSAMRRTQPEAVTMILTGYPAFETALEAIRQQVDDYLVKPASIPNLIKAIESKLAAPPRARQLSPPKRVAMLLQQNLPRVEELWLEAVDGDDALSRLPSTREQKRKAVQEILDEVVSAAQSYSGAEKTERERLPAAPGNRDFTGYTPSLLLAEFCLLRRTLAQVVQENLLAVNLSYLIPDFGKVNESLDRQAQAALAVLTERLGDSALIR
ncbi:MAG TPA: response regulator [Candidatus Aquilonibacter sp.]|nr:response regulator [Candidatus Aquilonibacter sp.]